MWATLPDSRSTSGAVAEPPFQISLRGTTPRSNRAKVECVASSSRSCQRAPGGCTGGHGGPVGVGVAVGVAAVAAGADAVAAGSVGAGVAVAGAVVGVVVDVGVAGGGTTQPSTDQVSAPCTASTSTR